MTDGGDLQLTPRASKTRCGFCLSEAEGEMVSCEECGAQYHAECLHQELRSCGTIGCRGRFPVEVQEGIAELEEARLGFADRFALSAMNPQRNYFALGVLAFIPGLLGFYSLLDFLTHPSVDRLVPCLLVGFLVPAARLFYKVVRPPRPPQQR